MCFLQEIQQQELLNSLRVQSQDKPCLQCNQSLNTASTYNACSWDLYCINDRQLVYHKSLLAAFNQSRFNSQACRGCRHGISQPNRPFISKVMDSVIDTPAKCLNIELGLSLTNRPACIKAQRYFTCAREP